MKYVKPYEEQLARVKRMYLGLQKYEIATDENFENAIDSFTSFFIQCHHLLDWLAESGYQKEVLYKYIESSKYLSVCHELANWQKHSKNKCCNKICDFGMFDYAGVTTPISRHIDFDNNAKFCIHAKDFGIFPLNVIDLVKNCQSEWEKFIENNLDPCT